jgi:hypothetical protein
MSRNRLTRTATRKETGHDRAINYTLTTTTNQPTHQGPNQPIAIVKMLASTMQISNNNPTNPLTPHTEELGRREDTESQPHSSTRGKTPELPNG